MNNLLEIFSTRELSLLVWLSLGLLATMFSKDLREAFGGVLLSLFDKVIGTILFMLTAYVCLLLFLLHRLGFWDVTLSKDTIFWFCTSALVLFFTINTAETNSYFKDIIKENLKWAIAIDFIVNFYTFSLTKELIFVPTTVLLVLLQAVSKTDNKYILVDNFLEKVIGFIGLAVWFFVLYKTVKNYQEVFTLHNLFAFLLPPILTILLISFLYLLAIYMKYELLFVRISFMTDDLKKQKLLKKEVMMNAKFNLNRLGAISKNLNKSDWYHSEDIRSYIRTLAR